MGITQNKGIVVDDVKLALMGRVKDDYVFNPEHKLSEGDQYYNTTVNPNDKVHVLVCVIPADTVSQMREEVTKKTLEIRRAASDLGIPQVAIITKIDKACPEIKKDLKNVYKSVYLKEMMEQLSVNVGIPINCIFPVRNYFEEIDFNDDVDSLTLRALRHIIDFGEDFMNHKMNFPEPVSQSVLDKPWRDINWRDKQSALQYVKDYKPHNEGRQLRILLHGPVGAGKSSFINSVKSVLQGRMSTLALVDKTMHGCFTKKYTTYKIEKGNPSTFYPFVFNDIMGLSKNGVLVEDVKLALKGRVRDNYTFNADQTLSEGDQYYNTTVNPNDKVHVLVCVIPADTASQIEDEVIRKVQEIRRAASELEIPQVAIITKIDQACPEIQEDLKNVYKSVKLKKKMEQFSAEVGIPMNCIFPVKNYSDEIDLNDDVESLVLSTLKHIINYGEEFMNHKMSQSEGSYE
ncbi:interferon-induced protein 44-like [Scomber scombrus]|uniref:Interferon-induced protein 44-like n=1 Tax=Scomber scombrus TaxID=13677 RepID=A0AAV1QLD2_SCOSC